MRVDLFEVSDEVSDEFWMALRQITGNTDIKGRVESWEDNWHVWCGCPL